MDMTDMSRSLEQVSIDQFGANKILCNLILQMFLHLFSFQTPILHGKKIRKNVKSIVGISPTMVLLFPVLL